MLNSGTIALMEATLRRKMLDAVDIVISIRWGMRDEYIPRDYYIYSAMARTATNTWQTFCELHNINFNAIARSITPYS